MTFKKALSHRVCRGRDDVLVVAACRPGQDWTLTTALPDNWRGIDDLIDAALRRDEVRLDEVGDVGLTREVGQAVAVLVKIADLVGDRPDACRAVAEKLYMSGDATGALYELLFEFDPAVRRRTLEVMRTVV